MIIKNSSISPTQIKKDFNDYIKTLTDSQKWIEFYKSSNNQLLLDTIAGFGTFLSYKYITNRDETYLRTAKSKESVKNIAISKGYKLNRIQTPELNITYTGEEPITVSKLVPIGYFNSDITIVPSETATVSKGNTFTAVFGEWVTVEETVGDVSGIVSYTINDVVDNTHIKLYVNNESIPLSDDLEDLLVKNEATQFTNYDTSVEITLRVKGAGVTFESRVIDPRALEPSDTVRIEYLKNLTDDRLTQSEINSIKFQPNYEPASGDYIRSYGFGEDDIEVIRYYASLFYSTLKRAVSKSDHDIIASTYAGIKSAVFQKAANCTGIVHYLLQDSTEARDTSKDFTLDAANTNPQGIWSDGTTMWLVDNVGNKIYAYNLLTKLRDASKDIPLLDGNADPYGIYSDGTTMWVVDNTDNKTYAYNLSTKARDASKGWTVRPLKPYMI